MKTVSLKLSEALEAQLTALIHQRRTSKAAVIRAALEQPFAFPSIARQRRFMCARRKRLPHEFRKERIVVDDQHPSHNAHTPLARRFQRVCLKYR